MNDTPAHGSHTQDVSARGVALRIATLISAALLLWLTGLITVFLFTHLPVRADQTTSSSRSLSTSSGSPLSADLTPPAPPSTVPTEDTMQAPCRPGDGVGTAAITGAELGDSTRLNTGPTASLQPSPLFCQAASGPVTLQSVVSALGTAALILALTDLLLLILIGVALTLLNGVSLLGSWIRWGDAWNAWTPDLSVLVAPSITFWSAVLLLALTSGSLGLWHLLNAPAPDEVGALTLTLIGGVLGSWVLLSGLGFLGRRLIRRLNLPGTAALN